MPYRPGDGLAARHLPPSGPPIIIPPHRAPQPPAHRTPPRSPRQERAYIKGASPSHMLMMSAAQLKSPSLPTTDSSSTVGMDALLNLNDDEAPVHVEREHAFSMTSIRKLQAGFTARCTELEQTIAVLQASLRSNLAARAAAEGRAAEAEERATAAMERAASLEARAVAGWPRR